MPAGYEIDAVDLGSRCPHDFPLRCFAKRDVLRNSGCESFDGFRHAIGSSDGYIYVRAEYPLAVKHIMLAVDQARERGYLGEKILGEYAQDLRGHYARHALAILEEKPGHH